MPLHRTYFHEIAQPAKIHALLEKLIETTATAEFRELAPDLAGGVDPAPVHPDLPVHRALGEGGADASNLVLLRHGFFPAVIHSIDRQRYYEAFRGTRGGVPHTC